MQIADIHRINSSSKLTQWNKQRTVGHTIWIIQLIKCIKVFALSAALLGARFRSSDAGLLGGIGASGGNDDGGNPNFEVPAGVNMGRRRSRAVLYQLSGHYKPEKIKTKLKLNNVSIYFRLHPNYRIESVYFTVFFVSFEELAPFNRCSVARIQNTSTEKIALYFVALWNVQRMLGLADFGGYVLCSSRCAIQCRLRENRSNDDGFGCYRWNVIYRRQVSPSSALNSFWHCRTRWTKKKLSLEHVASSKDVRSRKKDDLSSVSAFFRPFFSR